MPRDNGESNPQTFRKEIIETIPTVYEHQLVASFPITTKVIRGISIYDSYIIAITGPRGGIKSGTLAYCCMKFLAAGLPVFTNQPVKFNLIRRDGTKELLETQDLDFDKLFTHRDIHGGLVAIDEYQQWDRSSRAMTTQHLVLMGMWEQIRKLDLSFYYVAKRIELVPGDIAWETDIEINCQDITPFPGSGVACLWNIKDLSGLWTRHMFDPRNPVFYKQRFYHRAIWGSYSTKQSFDFYEAMKGVKVDLAKRLITDGNGNKELDLPKLAIMAKRMFDSADSYRPTEFWETLGVDGNINKGKARDYLEKEIGLTEKASMGRRSYALSNSSSSEVASPVS